MRKIVHTLFAGALAVMVAAPAFADPPNGRHDRDNRGWSRNDDHRDWGHDRRDWGHDRGDDRRDWRDDRHDDRRDWRDDRRDERYAYRDGYRDGYRSDYRNDWRYAWPRGRYDYAPRWHRGGYIPRHTTYVVVHDYHRYRLPPPRHGHHYIDADGEILMVAAATGLIVWALTN